jgi:cytochrome P450
VFAFTPAANRDPRVFPDPDRLDVTRPAVPHVSFGHGGHHCLGAPLARLELQMALTTLLARLPGLRLAVDVEELTWKSGGLVRGLAALPVAW